MRVTEKESALLVAIRDDQFQDGQPPVGTRVWTWSPCERFGTSAGGIMASLVKKGLADVDGIGEDATCWITQRGFDAVSRVGGTF